MASASSIRLYGDSGSLASLKCVLAATYSGIPVEFVVADSSAKASADFSRVSPLGRVPALEAGEGIHLFEANAISRFFASRTQQPAGKGKEAPKPALINGSSPSSLDQLLEYESREIGPASRYLFFAISLGDASDEHEKRLLNALQSIEKSLSSSSSSFLLGSSLTIADLLVFADLYPGFAPEGGLLNHDLQSRVPSVTAWFNRLLSQENTQKALSTVGSSLSIYLTALSDRATLERKHEKRVYTLSPKPEKAVYITTPIYYVNGEPHIGHVYTTLIADVLARWSRLREFDVYFMTGTDEHGQKVAQSAEKKGLTPKQFADQVSASFRTMFEKMNFQYDYYVRTTDENHHDAVNAIWKRLNDAGYITMGHHEGWYCVSDEAFCTELQVQDGVDKEGKPCKVSKESGHPVEWIREENLKFKLSAFQDKLLDWYERNPDMIMPRFRQKEVVQFIRGGLNDLSVSRTKLTCTWGIQVPDHPDHVMYVWLDALTNYLTSAGFPYENWESLKRWPADYQLVGKDILRFHAVYWPAFLMAAGLPLPKHIVAHGWWTKDSQKISKSLGNAFDPAEVAEKYGLDAFRYFLLRESNISADGDYNDSAMTKRLNSDLADDLGNLVLRCASKAINPDMVVPECGELLEVDRALVQMTEELPGAVDYHIFRCNIQQALASIWDVVKEMNRYVNNLEPWKLRKTNPDRLRTVLYVMIECMRIIALLVSPVMPDSSSKILDILGIPANLRTGSKFKFGLLPAGTPIPEDKTILFTKKEMPSNVLTPAELIRIGDKVQLLSVQELKAVLRDYKASKPANAPCLLLSGKKELLQHRIMDNLPFLAESLARKFDDPTPAAASSAAAGKSRAPKPAAKK